MMSLQTLALQSLTFLIVGGCAQLDLLPEGAVARMGEVRFHHPGVVRSLSFSPNGRRLASSGFEKTVVWDFSSGRELLRLESSAHVAFSPDGTVIATVARSGVVRLFDSRSGLLTREVQASSNSIDALAFAPNGKWFATVGDGFAVRVFEVLTGKRRFELLGHSRSVRCVRFSPDSMLLASGCSGSEVILWSMHTGSPVHKLCEVPGPPGDLAFSPNGLLLAMGGMTGRRGPDSAIHIWDTESGGLVRKIAPGQWGARRRRYAPNSVASLQILPGGEKLISSGYGGLQTWDVETGNLDRTYSTSSGRESLAVSPSGQYAAVGGHHGFRVFDLTNGRERYLDRHHGSITGVSISSSGRFVVSRSSDESTCIWDARTGRPLRMIRMPVVSVAHRPGTTEFVAAGDPRRGIVVFDSATGREKRTIPATEGYCFANYSPRGLFLAVTSDNGAVAVLDGETGEVRRKLAALRYSPPVFFPDCLSEVVRISEHGRIVALLSKNGVYIWGSESEASGYKLVRTSGVCAGIALSADGSILVTCGESLKVWETATGKCLKTMSCGKLVTAVALSPDGTRIASCGTSKAVRIWNVESGDLLHTFLGHVNVVASVVFSADGTRVVSGGQDGWVFVWDLGAIVKSAARESNVAGVKNKK